MNRKNAIGDSSITENDFLIEIILNEEYDISIREAAYHILTNIIEDDFYKNNIIKLFELALLKSHL